jgi:hypothetical protein
MKLLGRMFSLAGPLLVLVACSSEAPPAVAPSDATPAADAAASADALSGTWILNVSKSTYSPPDLGLKSNKVVLEVVGDSVHVITDGVDSQERPTHAEYTAKLDGSDVATNGTVAGKPNTDVNTASWRKIDDHTYEVTNKGTGQVLTTNRIVIAADGKSRTSTVTGKGPKGQTINNTLVMEKQ